MFVSSKKWELPETLYHAGNILQYIMDQRAVSDNLEDFLHCSKEQLFSPFLMKGMKKAVSRIRAAIENQEKIAIYGDYDADGVTATSLLFLTLQKIGALVEFYVPDRMREGYGLHQEALAKICDNGVTLMITVDTGISAVNEVQYGKSLGLDIIITDHHEPPEIVPNAYVILNPKYKPCEYPETDLAGVGVAFKLASALLDRVAEEYLDLVALGTVADLVPLVGENRTIVSLGLQVINQSPSRGIRALIQISGLYDKLITAGHLGFQLGPRINASGRLENAAVAVRLLTSDDQQEVGLIAERLDETNKQRQELVEETFKQAEEKLQQVSNNLNMCQVIVLADERWNHGIIGIVASRLLEKYYRPVVLIAIEGDIGKGSARSIRNFHMFQALQNCEQLLTRYGGHAMAAGFSLPTENIAQLQVMLNKIASECLSEADYIPSVSVDIVLNIAEIIREQQQIKSIGMLAPFGIGNSHPKTLVSGAVYKSGKLIGKEQSHVKFVFAAASHQLEVIAFRWAEKVESWISRPELTNIRFDLVGELSINEWNRMEKPQLTLIDCAISAVQVADSLARAREIERVLAEQGIASQLVSEDDVVDIDFIDLCEQVFSSKNTINVLRHSKVYIIVMNVRTLRDKVCQCRVPDRKDFATAYKLACRSANIDKEIWLAECFEEGLDRAYCEQILEIFDELEFLNVVDGKICIVERPDRKKLDDSVLYAKLHHRALLMQKHVSF